MLEKANKVLILRFSSIGDIVLTSPIIRCLFQQLGCEIHYLTKSQYADLLTHNPYISRVHTFSQSITEIKAALLSENYDYIIDLHKNLRSRRVITMLGKPHLQFYKANVKKWLMVYAKRKAPVAHIVDRYFNALPVQNDGQGLDFFVPQDLVVEVVTKDEIEAYQPYTVINLGATHGTKRIPSAKINAIVDRYPHKMILIGGADVKEESEKILKKENIVNLVGRTSLLESAYLVRGAQVMITGDSGMMHIGAAYKVPMITLWGSTVPALGMYPYYGTEQVEHYNHEVASLSCRPCTKIGRTGCPKKHFRCMHELSQDQLFESYEKLVK